jgi:hypothetical protein
VSTITLEHRKLDGPFKVGDGYDGDVGDRHIHGVIAGVVPTGPQHVAVTVRLPDGESPQALGG